MWIFNPEVKVTENELSCTSVEENQAFLSSSKDYLYHVGGETGDFRSDRLQQSRCTGNMSLRQVTGVNRWRDTHTHTILHPGYVYLEQNSPCSCSSERLKGMIDRSKCLLSYSQTKNGSIWWNLEKQAENHPPPSAIVSLLTKLYHLVEHCGRARGEELCATQEEIWSSVSKEGLTSSCGGASSRQDKLRVERLKWGGKHLLGAWHHSANRLAAKHRLV